jgi:hypothetical protein
VERRAVVLEVQGRHATVLIEGGEVRRVAVPPDDVVPGQEIWVPEESPWGWRTLAAAAMLALALLGGGLWSWSHTATPVAAVVSMDINPSFQLGVSVSDQVLWAEPLDAAARRLLHGVPVTGDPLDLAVQDLADAAARAGYLTTRDNLVVLAGGPVNGRVAVPRVTATLTELERRLAGDLAGDPSLHHARVVVLPTASAAVVAQARALRLSVGRYLLAKLAHVSPDQARRRPVAALLDAWTRPRAHQSGKTTPRGSPAAAHHVSRPAPPAAGKESRSTSSVPATVVVGILQDVTTNHITVGDQGLTVAADAVVEQGNAVSPWSLTTVAAAIGQRVQLHLANGLVTALRILGPAVPASRAGNSAPGSEAGHAHGKHATVSSSGGSEGTATSAHHAQEPQGSPGQDHGGRAGGNGQSRERQGGDQGEGGDQGQSPHGAVPGQDHGQGNRSGTRQGDGEGSQGSHGSDAGEHDHGHHGRQSGEGGPGGNQGRPTPAVHVTGILTAVGSGTLTVGGTLYTLAPDAVWQVGEHTSPLSPADLLAAIGSRVRLTIRSDMVVAVRLLGSLAAPPPGHEGGPPSDGPGNEPS